MIKKIAIITFEKSFAFFYKQTLEELFLDKIEVEGYSLQDTICQKINADIVLVSAYFIYEQIKKHIPDSSYIMIADLSLTKNSLAQITELPLGTKAMLVNSTLEMAVDTIRLIRNANINHVDLYPYYPGAEIISNCKLAITPGEIALVPKSIEQVMDIGDRVLSMETIVQIANKLNLEYMLSQSQMTGYFENLFHKDIGLEKMLLQVWGMRELLEILGKIFEGCIISLDNQCKISFINSLTEKILNIKRDNSIGKEISNFISELNYENLKSMQSPIRDKIIEIDNQLFTLSVYSLSSAQINSGYIVLIRRLNDVEKDQEKIRKQIIDKGYIAKYTFDDIITATSSLNSLKETARKMAFSSSSIHIYGKSGTGKELFAQSIHLASNRKDKPFIAINCAAIPPNLLESELFGYAEGAFTGAKKGGKAGYFELADKGTLFLDEISEMEYSLQTRLLRTLQEKEVVRVGGDRVIPIDVRIISASNKKLKEMVKENKFREDLFYRLEVLSLKLPDLCERKEDIPILIEHFKKEFNANFYITEKAMATLQNYNWEGNIRELHNFVERITYMGREILDLDDIMEHLYIDEEKRVTIEQNENLATYELERYIAILSVLKEHSPMGRKRLSEIINDTISEQEIRRLLKKMEQNQYVIVGVGRQGSAITEKGEMFLKKYL